MIPKILFLCCLVLMLTACSTSTTTSTSKVPVAVSTEEAPKLQVGQQVPLLQGVDMQGRTIDLADYVGKKPLMLVFWTTWSGGCQRKVPEVNAIMEKYGKEDLEIIGINVGMGDTPEKALAFMDKHNVTYPTIYDKTGELSEKYQLNKVFFLILVAKDGTMLMRVNEVPDFDDSVLEMLNTYKR